MNTTWVPIIALHCIAAHADGPPRGRQGGQGRRMPDAASGGCRLPRGNDREPEVID